MTPFLHRPPVRGGAGRLPSSDRTVRLSTVRRAGAIIGAMSAPVGSPQLLLASASPRRRRLLAWLGAPFEVTSVDVDETPSPELSEPAAIALDIAERKAVAARELHPDAAILAADTIVVADGELLGKPVDEDDAWRMLRALAGRTHEVITGFALWLPGADAPAGMAVATNVNMRDLTEDEMAAWVADGELMGCAGAYNIERHLAWVADDECYQNVAGLPLCHLYALMCAEGAADQLERPDIHCDAARGARCKLGPCMLGRGCR